MVTGTWFGSCVKAGLKTAMVCYVEQQSNIIRGWGADLAGVFGISGAMSKGDNRIAWVKAYLELAPVRYSGVLRSETTLSGLWYALPTEMGTWEIQLSRVSTPSSGGRDIVWHGLTTWINGEYLEAGRLFAQAGGIEKRPETALAAGALLEKSGLKDDARDQFLLARELNQQVSTVESGTIISAIEGYLGRVSQKDSHELNIGEYRTTKAPALLEEFEETLTDKGPGEADSIHGSNPNLMNSIAWTMYIRGDNLEKALECARLSYQRQKNCYVAHTLCAILVRLGNWPDARPLFSEWMFGPGRSMELRTRWNSSFRSTFLDIVAHGFSSNAAQLLADLGDPIPWLRGELLNAARGETISLIWPDEA